MTEEGHYLRFLNKCPVSLEWRGETAVLVLLYVPLPPEPFTLQNVVPRDDPPLTCWEETG